jgi:hypothetical protein
LLSKIRSSGVDARKKARASSGVKLCVASSFYNQKLIRSISFSNQKILHFSFQVVHYHIEQVVHDSFYTLSMLPN